ncbi:MAG: hypothetical protein ACR2PR_00270 [Pseudohongiellaceae bacterium]
MRKDINITIAHNTWPGKVPTDISRLAGKTDINIRRGLFHTALITRPPCFKGFHLSDCWAFMRYYYAFAKTKPLSLKPEWEDIDRHQKTVMSDDLGMGFTTQFLAERLGFSQFADTLHFMQVSNPNVFSFHNAKKIGPQKIPDFIATDISPHKFNVVECKGTQVSRARLRKAMQRGMEQKRNVAPQNNSYLNHRLVVGLFVPKSTSSESAEIHIMDPDYTDLDRLIGEQGQEQVSRSITQIDLAKHLALFGAPLTANILSITPTKNLNGSLFVEAAKKELQGLSDKTSIVRSMSDGRENLQDVLRSTHYKKGELQYLEDELQDLIKSMSDEHVGELKAKLHIPEKFIANILEANDLLKLLENLSEGAYNRAQLRKENEEAAEEVGSSMGFKMEFILE